MIPIDSEINLSKVKVTVAFKLMIYRQNIVHIITTHNIGSIFRAVGQATFFTRRIFSSLEHEVHRMSYCDSEVSVVLCTSFFVRHQLFGLCTL